MPNSHFSASCRKAILIVDDEKCVTDALRDLILYEIPDFEVLIASTYEEAFRILNQNQHILFILTDYTLPGQNGMQLIGELNKNERWRDVQKALMSGRTFTTSEKSVLQEAGVWVFEKPFCRQVLESLIERIRNISV